MKEIVHPKQVALRTSEIITLSVDVTQKGGSRNNQLGINIFPSLRLEGGSAALSQFAVHDIIKNNLLQLVRNASYVRESVAVHSFDVLLDTRRRRNVGVFLNTFNQSLIPWPVLPWTGSNLDVNCRQQRSSVNDLIKQKTLDSRMARTTRQAQCRVRSSVDDQTSLKRVVLILEHSLVNGSVAFKDF